MGKKKHDNEKIPGTQEDLKKVQDAITGFLDAKLMMPSIQEMLKKFHHLGFIYTSLADYSEITKNYGSNIFDFICKDIGKFLRQFSKEISSEKKYTLEIFRYGNAFLLLVFYTTLNEIMTYKELNILKERIKVMLANKVLTAHEHSLDTHLSFLTGCSVLSLNGKTDFEHLFFEGLENAIIDSAQEKGRDVLIEELVLHDVINKGLISAVYQPIINIEKKRILGFEVLSRGSGTDYKEPEALFHLAYKHDLVLPLDRRCRENAFRAGKYLDKEHLLFINSEIESIFDIHFNMKNTMLAIERNQLTPERIIIELTEKAAIKDFQAFKQAIETLKMLGFKIAIDDIGYAYSGLRKIVELNPDFIKVDMSLIRDIHKNMIKKNLISSVVNFAQKARISIIAEGVETKEELETVRSIGVKFIQGFYLCYPSADLKKIMKINFKEKLDL